MADVLKRVAGPTSLTTSAVTYYTVPAGVTATLRNIHVANIVTGLASFTLAIGSANTTSNCLYYQCTVPGNGAFDWSGVLVMAAGETLSIMANTANLTVTVSAVESS